MARAPGPPIFWDSSVLIDHLEGAPRSQHVTPVIIQQALRGTGPQIVTSTVALLEVIKVMGDSFGPECEAFFGLDGSGGQIRLVPFELRVTKHARTVKGLVDAARRQDIADGLTPPPQIHLADLIHVASALSIGAEGIHTYDGTHLTPWHMRLGIPIRAPHAEQQMLGELSETPPGSNP